MIFSAETNLITSYLSSWYKFIRFNFWMSLNGVVSLLFVFKCFSKLVRIRKNFLHICAVNIYLQGPELHAKDGKVFIEWNHTAAILIQRLQKNLRPFYFSQLKIEYKGNKKLKQAINYLLSIVNNTSSRFLSRQSHRESFLAWNRLAWGNNLCPCWPRVSWVQLSASGQMLYP